MRDKRAWLLFVTVLILSANLHTAESAPAALRKPWWAESKEPETMRGRLIAGRLRAADGFSYLISGISEQDLVKFNAQEVEVKAWVGVETVGNRYTWRVQLVEAPRIIVPARWSYLLAAMLALTLIFAFISRKQWGIYGAFVAPLIGLCVIVFYFTGLGQYGKDRISEALLASGKVALIPILLVVLTGAARKKVDFRNVLAAAFFSFGLVLTLLPALEHYTFKNPVPINDLRVLAAAVAVVVTFVVLPRLLKPVAPAGPAVSAPEPAEVSQKA